MTDILEELLDEQEEDRAEAEVPVWGDVPLSGHRLAAEEAALPHGPRLAAGADWSEVDRQVQQVGGGGGIPAVPDPPGMTAADEAAVGAGTQAAWGTAFAAPAAGDPAFPVGRGRERAGGARALYRTLRRTEQAAGYTRREVSSPLTAPPQTREGGGVPAAALDQIFQRDARRYDGGFPLY